MWIFILTYSHIHLNTCPCKTPYIKSHLHLPLQNIYTYWTSIYFYPCKTSTHTNLKSHFPMSMCNWMLPRFPDNYRRERDSDKREYYVRLQREWDFRVNESNALHDDLVRLGAPLINHNSLTLPLQNMHQYEHAVTKKKKRKKKTIWWYFVGLGITCYS